MNRIFLAVAVAIIGYSSLIISGCKDDATNPELENIASQDAADIVASSSSSDNGGMNDQLTDIADFAQSSINFSTTGSATQMLRFGSLTRSYDGSFWTVTAVRNYSSGVRSGNWKRQYKIQFLNAANQAQPYFVTSGQLAAKVTFEIISDSCSGDFISPRVSHELRNLSGKSESVVSVSGNDTLLTINSINPRNRSALDTVKFRRGTRVSDHSLTMNLQNVVVAINPGRRFNERFENGYRFRNVRPQSGTITGNYSAELTFLTGGNVYDQSVNRNFTITFGGSETTLAVTGGGANVSGTINLETGDVTLN